MSDKIAAVKTEEGLYFPADKVEELWVKENGVSFHCMATVSGHNEKPRLYTLAVFYSAEDAHAYCGILADSIWNPVRVSV